MADIFKSAEYAKKLAKETVVLSPTAQEAREMITLLTDVRKLIELPMRWTVGTRGKTEDGRNVAPKDRDAIAWCILGAGEKVNKKPPPNSKYYMGVDMMLSRALGFNNPHEVAQWNNNSTHAEVIRRIDKRIQHWEKVT